MHYHRQASNIAAILPRNINIEANSRRQSLELFRWNYHHLNWGVIKGSQKLYISKPWDFTLTEAISLKVISNQTYIIQNNIYEVKFGHRSKLSLMQLEHVILPLKKMKQVFEEWNENLWNINFLWTQKSFTLDNLLIYYTTFLCFLPIFFPPVTLVSNPNFLRRIFLLWF